MTKDELQQNAKSVQEVISKEMGVSELPEEQQQRLIGKVGEVILKKILLETLDRLSEDDRAAFEALLKKKPSDEELRAFLTEKIPDYDEMAEKIAKEFIAEVKSDVASKASV